MKMIVVECDCLQRTPTYPVYRDFVHFPECPISQVGYWEQRANQYFREANEWEERYLRLLDHLKAHGITFPPFEWNPNQTPQQSERAV